MIKSAFNYLGKNYFYHLLRHYLGLYIFAQDVAVEIDPPTEMMKSFASGGVIPLSGKTPSERDAGLEELARLQPDFLLLNGVIHYERDIQSLFTQLRGAIPEKTRLVLTYYSGLWRPVIQFATFLGLRDKVREQNWISDSDVANLCTLADFEVVRHDCRVLLPFYIPVLSNWVNRYLAPLPFIRLFTLVNIVVARPVRRIPPVTPPSVSVVVAARNEAGNIENLVRRLPKMGPDDELIIVEGNSTDATWDTILAIKEKYAQTMKIIAAQQDGKGKGDAVRKGFSLASKEILMILDADLTVPPEDLPKFYGAIASGKGEYINGSRLVYPMEKNAMRFFNMIGNKFFALAFSFVVGQRFKDTLCGTKVISRENYEKLAAHRTYFGEFDPFGDFDLIFGSARLGLSIVEVPIHYRERTYGDTNIQRWRHGVILLRMTLFAARKIKFI